MGVLAFHLVSLSLIVSLYTVSPNLSYLSLPYKFYFSLGAIPLKFEGSRLTMLELVNMSQMKDNDMIFQFRHVDKHDYLETRLKLALITSPSKFSIFSIYDF